MSIPDKSGSQSFDELGYRRIEWVEVSPSDLTEANALARQTTLDFGADLVDRSGIESARGIQCDCLKLTQRYVVVRAFDERDERL